MAGKQESDGGDRYAEDGHDSPGRHAGREGAAIAAVLGAPPVAQFGGQLGPARGQAVDGGRGHAERGEQQQAREQRAAQLGGFGQRGSDADEAEQRKRGLRPVGTQRFPPFGLLAGLRRAQEGGLASEQATPATRLCCDAPSARKTAAATAASTTVPSTASPNRRIAGQVPAPRACLRTGKNRAADAIGAATIAASNIA